ncbi:MAG: hypothetical protein IJR47_00440 [Clostridia bacterium]|nr:hypothetical protein [Clostridia bacterium]
MIKRVLAISLMFGLGCSATAYAMEAPVLDPNETSGSQYAVAVQSDYMFAMAQTGADVNLSELDKPIIINPTESATETETTLAKATDKTFARTRKTVTRAVVDPTTGETTFLTQEQITRALAETGESEEDFGRGFIPRDETAPSNNVVEITEETTEETEDTNE